MGVPEFYLNFLSGNRLDFFEFFLSINQYVQNKEEGTVQSSSPLPAKVHPEFSPDVGDLVWYFVRDFSKENGFMRSVDIVMDILESEEFTDVPQARNYILRAANKYILSPPSSDTTSRLGLDFRDYLLDFVSQLSVTKELTKIQEHCLKISVSSPAIIEVRNFLDFYAQFFKLNDPKSYMKFFACVCSVLLRLGASIANDSIFQVLGEFENVIFKYSRTFPGYENLDNIAKYEKLVVSW